MKSPATRESLRLLYARHRLLWTSISRQIAFVIGSWTADSDVTLGTRRQSPAISGRLFAFPSQRQAPRRPASTSWSEGKSIISTACYITVI